jgi:hypothetical protein
MGDRVAIPSPSSFHGSGQIPSVPVGSRPHRHAIMRGRIVDTPCTNSDLLQRLSKLPQPLETVP